MRLLQAPRAITSTRSDSDWTQACGARLRKVRMLAELVGALIAPTAPWPKPPAAQGRSPHVPSTCLIDPLPPGVATNPAGTFVGNSGYNICLLKARENSRAGGIETWFFVKNRVLDDDEFRVRAGY